MLQQVDDAGENHVRTWLRRRVFHVVIGISIVGRLVLRVRCARRASCGARGATGRRTSRLALSRKLQPKLLLVLTNSFCVFHSHRVFLLKIKYELN